MIQSRRVLGSLVGLGLSLFLGCGGGHHAADSAPSPVIAHGTYGSYATEKAALGCNATAAILAVNGSLTDISWTQTGGPAVDLLADKTQAISFDPPATGTYGFRASFTDGSGARRSQDFSLPVFGSTGETQLTLRASQAVRMGGNVSLRAWPSLVSGDQVQSISWSQLSGPRVTLDTQDPSVAFFKAPSVSQDSLVRLKATLRTSAGRTASDEVAVVIEHCVQASATDPNAVWSDTHVSRVHPYVANSPYAGVLVKAVYDPTELCAGAKANMVPLSQLPFIGQETNGAMPSVEQVMNHVVVSHDWLGRNFEQFLLTQDGQGDFRRLLNGVTAIVLGVHVRPSFYYAVTGAIYLDADNFWLTPEERDLIDETPDYRSGYGSALAFSAPWRYVKNNAYVSTYYYADERVTRTQADLVTDLASLLYHELGHAADFMPPSQYASLDSSLSAWDNIYARFDSGDLISDGLNTTYPLSSIVMGGLAEVSFQGRPATDGEKAYTPLEVANYFEPDGATDMYAYNTSREDAAMLFEEFMMKTRLGIQRDVAFADPITESTTGRNLIVRWGQRGRIGSTQIKPRLTYILTRMAPWMDASAVAQLPAPTAMRAGDSWYGNLSLTAPASNAMNVQVQPDPRALRRDLLRRLPGVSLPRH